LADEPEAKAEDVFADDYVRHDLRPTQAERFPTFGGASISSSPRMTSSLPAGQHQARTTGEWAGIAPTKRRAEFSGVNIFQFGLGGRWSRSGISATTSA
jgi:hypothetical protein